MTLIQEEPIDMDYARKIIIRVESVRIIIETVLAPMRKLHAARILQC